MAFPLNIILGVCRSYFPANSRVNGHNLQALQTFLLNQWFQLSYDVRKTRFSKYHRHLKRQINAHRNKLILKFCRSVVASKGFKNLHGNLNF